MVPTVGDAPASPSSSASLPPSVLSTLPHIEGTAHVEMTGDRELTFDAPVFFRDGPPLVHPSPGRVVVSFSDRHGHNLGLSLDPGFEGTEPTKGDSRSLTINLFFDGVSFRSTRGECRISIDRLEEGTLEGTFHCEGIPSTGDASTRVDADGTFETTKE
jgi:hypothetical protein